MKTLVLILIVTLVPLSVLAQGLQGRGHHSGGDEKADYTIAVHTEWNLVSVPIAVGNYLVIDLFPTATSDAYAFQGGYIVSDTLDNGPGYWLKFAASQTFSLSGSLINADTIPVSTGWNMVGSISDPIASSSVTGVGTIIQSSFFSFNNGYQVAATITPGMAYWVKTSSNGALVMSSGSVPAKQSVQDSLIAAISNLNSLTIADAAGGNQTLYFGQTDARIREMAELPPVPPSGIFDARFASHSMIASDDEGVLLSSAVFPVDVHWAVATPGNYTLVVDDKEIELNTTSSIRLSHPTSHISLRIGASAELPKVFALRQNYPNPFNPSTTIKYDLPVDSQVQLKLYNVLGQEVATLVNQDERAGYKSVEWNAGLVATGVYFYRLQAGNFTQIRKMLLVK